MGRALIELHLGADTELPRRYGKTIRELGGEYSEVRGYATERFVTLPASPRGWRLADELLARYPRSHHRSTVVLRCFGRVDALVLHPKTAEEARAALVRHARRLFQAGKLPRPETAAQRRAARFAFLRSALWAHRSAAESIARELAEAGEPEST